jgi:hypothetical protein
MLALDSRIIRASLVLFSQNGAFARSSGVSFLRVSLGILGSRVRTYPYNGVVSTVKSTRSCLLFARLFVQHVFHPLDVPKPSFNGPMGVQQVNRQARSKTLLWRRKRSVLWATISPCQFLDAVLHLQVTFRNYPECGTELYVEMVIKGSLTNRPLHIFQVRVGIGQTGHGPKIVTDLELASTPSQVGGWWVTRDLWRRFDP